MNESSNNDADQKRRIRNSALLLGGIALMFFIGFIAVSAMRG